MRGRRDWETYDTQAGVDVTDAGNFVFSHTMMCNGVRGCCTQDEKYRTLGDWMRVEWNDDDVSRE